MRAGNLALRRAGTHVGILALQYSAGVLATLLFLLFSAHKAAAAAARDDARDALVPLLKIGINFVSVAQLFNSIAGAWTEALKDLLAAQNWIGRYSFNLIAVRALVENSRVVDPGALILCSAALRLSRAAARRPRRSALRTACCRPWECRANRNRCSAHASG